MDKCSVLFVTRKWPPTTGGMEKYNYELAGALSKLCETDVVHPLGPQAVNAGDARRSVMFLWHAFIQTWRKAPEADVVHIGDVVIWPISLIVRLRAKNARVVCVLYGLDLLYGKQGGLLAKLYSLYLRMAQRWHSIDEFVAISRNTARLAKEGGFGPVTVVRPGVCTEIGPTKGDVRAGRDPQMILFVGRVVERKGLRWFVQQVLPALPQTARVVVAGPARSEDVVRQLKGLRNVEYWGRVTQDELERLWQQAAVQIMPNRSSECRGDAEGFGLVAAEAAVRGLPVVASGIEGIPDAVIEGKTGFLVDPDDLECWRERIEEILSWSVEEREAFEKSCRARAQEEFNWDRVADEMVRVYTAGSSSEAVRQ